MINNEEIIDGFRFTGRFWLPLEQYTRRPDPVKHLVVHCADTKATWDGGVDQIRKWHIEDNGWSDVGYHFVIKRDGTIQRGRPVWAVGSGAAGYNSHSIHVCLVGGQDNAGNPEDNFRPIQKAACAFLLAALKRYVAPTAEVCGHRDFPGVKKACPSFDAKAWWRGETLKPAAMEPVKGFVFQQMVRGEVWLN